jgi:hypothetical protein
MFLKQSTSTTVLVGPVLDASGVAVTTAVIGDFTLTKNGTAATMSGNTISHSHNGHYLITLTAGNTDTIGRLAISVNNSAQAMTLFRWDICQPTVYDALFSNAVNTSGGLPAATGSISALAGAISTFAGGAVASVTAAVTVGTNNDKTGYSLTQAFPSNFASLGINSSGHVSRVTLVDTTTTNTDMRGTDNALLAASYTAAPTAAAVADAVWDEAMADHTTSTSYGGRIIRAANSNVTAQLTGSNHMACDVHAFQPDVIDAAAIATSAVTELQAGLATAVNLAIVSDRVSYCLTALVGACSDAQTAAETYTLSIGGSTFTVDYLGLDSSGNRSTTTLTKV